jgi:hypothetical protein
VNVAPERETQRLTTTNWTLTLKVRCLSLSVCCLFVSCCRCFRVRDALVRVVGARWRGDWPRRAAALVCVHPARLVPVCMYVCVYVCMLLFTLLVLDGAAIGLVA